MPDSHGALAPHAAASAPQTSNSFPEEVIRGSVPSLLNTAGLEPDAQQQLIARVIDSYDAPIVRWYCRIRFLIMRLRFLEEIDQYIPKSGRILDLGCGFGLFSLFFASRASTRSVHGYDINERRIQTATTCAAKLGLTNVRYEVSDAGTISPEGPLTCVYMLDLLHHLPSESVMPLLRRICAALAPDGVLIIKDVDTRPAYKRWFTLALDRLMVGMEPIRYWSKQEMLHMVAQAGFRAYTHDMRDWLPYPHRLYVCRKDATFPQEVTSTDRG